MKTDSLRVLLVAFLATVLSVASFCGSASSARTERPSERFDLAREIPTQRNVLVREGRISASDWAAYVFGNPPNPEETGPCAYIGVVTAASPSTHFFRYDGECAGLWPQGGVSRPALVFVRQRSYYHRRIRPEGMGLVLTAPTVKRLHIRFRGKAGIWAVTKKLSSRDSTVAQVQPLSYATFSVHLDRCIRSLTAYGVGPNPIGKVKYSDC